MLSEPTIDLVTVVYIFFFCSLKDAHSFYCWRLPSNLQKKLNKLNSSFCAFSNKIVRIIF